MEKIWLKNYEPGVPEFIDPDAYPSLVALASESFKEFANKPSYTNMGKTLTFKEVDELSTAFAGFLQQKCKLKAGDRVMIMMPNLLQYPIALFGILKARLTVVNVNPLYTPRELKSLAMDSGATTILVLENFANVVEKALPETQIKNIIVTRVGDCLSPLKGALIHFVLKYIKKKIPAWDLSATIPFKETIKHKWRKAYMHVDVQPTDIAFLQYTGGTTGGLKGAMLTHRNMVANVMQACAWVKSLHDKKPTGGIVTALPLYHIFSLTANCLTFLREGILNILITNPRDIPGFAKELKRQPFSMITGVNTLFNALLHNKAFCELDFSKLILTLGGGMSVQKPVAEKWHQVTGVPLLEAYGLTETSPAVTINPLSLKEYNGTIGLPISSTEIKIIDEQGNTLSLDMPGELCVRGPQVMLGYWNQPEQTKTVLDEQGWLKTGDIAIVNKEGYVKIVDRKKDMILVSGFNVYPNEIEEVIAGIPGVLEVAVIGVQSLENGEKVKAFIVRSDPNLSKEAILDYCHKELTNYKVPKEIEFRDELPKTNVGKVMRKTLREEAKLKETA